MNKDYTPIPCAIYNRYEHAILNRDRLRIVWHGARDMDRIETLSPVDLRTRSGAEYMIAKNQFGHSRVIRLDRIKCVETVWSTRL
jgi:Rho-binding antiterminator